MLFEILKKPLAEYFVRYTIYSRFDYTILISILLLILTSLCFPQNSHNSSYQFISPMPNSSLLLPETSIIIREGNLINEASLFESSVINVIGSGSGTHSGSLLLADDGKTIIFKPHEKFYYGEEIKVSYTGGIYKLNGEELVPLNFTFNICKKKSLKDYRIGTNNLLELGSNIVLSMLC